MAGRALIETQCTLEEEAQYVNVRGSIHWEGMYSAEKCRLGVQTFLIIKIDPNQKRPTSHV